MNDYKGGRCAITKMMVSGSPFLKDAIVRILKNEAGGMNERKCMCNRSWFNRWIAFDGD